MSVEKELTILAVTKMHGGVCTAGIGADGRWVRPVRPSSERGQNHETITDYCLLPLDFFHGGRSHLLNLGVTRFWLATAAPQPPHVEDWTLDLTRKPQLIGKLSREEQARFLAAHVESGLSLLEAAGGRSLALCRPENFSFSFGLNKTGDDVTVRASFAVAGQEMRDVGCTDLRMRALGRKLLERSGGASCALNSEDFRRHGKEATYFAVGLSRLYRGKHWLILVGVHALPEIEVEIDYARL